MSASKKGRVLAPKVIITMAQGHTKVDFTAQVSGVELINGITAFAKDINKITGIGFKEIFGMMDEVCTQGKTFRKNPTMRASESEVTANEDED